MYAYDWNFFNFFELDNLAAGTYKLTVQVTWDTTYGNNDVKDYTVRVYSPQVVTITNSATGAKSSYNYILTPNTTSGGSSSSSSSSGSSSSSSSASSSSSSSGTTSSSSSKTSSSSSSVASANSPSLNGFNINSFYLSQEVQTYNLANANFTNHTYYSEYDGWANALGPNDTNGKDLFVYLNSTKYNVNVTYTFKNPSGTIVSSGAPCTLRTDL